MALLCVGFCPPGLCCLRCPSPAPHWLALGRGEGCGAEPWLRFASKTGGLCTCPEEKSGLGERRTAWLEGVRITSVRARGQQGGGCF